MSLIRSGQLALIVATSGAAGGLAGRKYDDNCQHKNTAKNDHNQPLGYL